MTAPVPVRGGVRFSTIYRTSSTRRLSRKAWCWKVGLGEGLHRSKWTRRQGFARTRRGAERAMARAMGAAS